MIASVATRVVAAAGPFVVGLLIGSFLNVVVYRVPRRLSVVTPGSFCPTCQAPIRGYDNVPVVSWLVLRGKCRQCGAPISLRYPAVEVSTGVLFGLLGAAVGARWALPGLCVLGATILALALFEVDGVRPVAAVAWIGTALGTALVIATAAGGHRWWRLGGALIGMGVGISIVALVARVERRSLGSDRSAWSLVPLGALVGWLGLVGSGVGVLATACALFATRRAARKSSNRRRNAGLALAATIGSVVAVAGAWAAGQTLRS